MRRLAPLTVLLFVLSLACSGNGADDPLERCGLPSDYDVLQVPPDPCLWSDPEFGETFTAAVEATNVAKGPCHSTSFTVVGDDGSSRTYHDGDRLQVTIAYEAPGCVEATLTFGGLHLNGSPGAMHYCREGGCNYGGINSNIFAAPVALIQDVGELTFVAQPGSFPPADLASPPNLEGFQVCSLVVGFNDGQPDGSRTSDQLNLSSPASDQRP